MLTKESPTRYKISLQQGNSTILLFLDSSIPNGLGVVHGQIIEMITTNESDLAYLEELMLWNNNFAFMTFCIQKGLVIPPDPVETPSE